MNKISIPRNAKVTRQFIIIHNQNVMYETKPSLIYEETLFSNGNNIFLSYSYNGKYGCLKNNIYGITYLRNELINTLFNEKINIDPFDAENFFKSFIKDYISKDMNLNINELIAIPLFTAFNFNR